MAEIDLRAATAADRPFLDTLHRDAMGPSIQATRGADGMVPTELFGAGFENAGWMIIERDAVAVGAWRCVSRVDCLYLDYIALRPEHQGRGIGSLLLEGLIRESARLRVPIRLHVLDASRARRLYERLGFEYTGRSPSGHHMKHDGSSDALVSE